MTTGDASPNPWRIEVLGTPVPQGSMQAFARKDGGRPIVTADNKRTKPWRQEIAAVAAERMGGASPFEGPLCVSMAFHMPKPKSAAKKLVYPTTKPDVDKLARAVLDGLVAGGAMKDDAQVSMVIAEKRYAIDRAPGVVITMLKRQG